MACPNRNHRLRLLVYQGTGGNTVPLSEYLRKHGLGDVDWTPGLSQLGMDLTVGGESQWPSWKTIGDLARTAFQWEAAAARLRSGEPALVRIGIDDFPIGAYLRFTPRDDVFLISSLAVNDPGYSFRYPLDESGHAISEVYEHIVNLDPSGIDQAAARDEAGLPALNEVAFPRDVLLSDMDGEAASARRLCSELGADFFLELY